MNFKWLIVMIIFISCKSDKKNIIISKYLDRKGMNTTSVVHKILKSNTYDNNLNIIIEKDYSRTGCNLVDSTIFSYADRNQLIEKKHYSAVDVLSNCRSKFDLREHILFKYNSYGGLLSRQVLKGIDLEVVNKSDAKNINFATSLKDSLSLLKIYISDLQFIADNTSVENFEQKNIGNTNIYLFNVNAVTSILLDYGIPSSELLLKAKVFIQNKKIIKDEFIFEKYILTRTYFYENNLLQKVVIENNQISNNSKSISIESFINSEL